MRLLLVVLLAAVVALGGCGGDDDSDSSTAADAGATTTETAPGGVTETSPAETTETESERQGSDDDAGDQGGSSGGTSGGSSDDGGASSGSGGASSGGAPASGEDKQAATSTVTGFYAALSSGDGAKACDLMADAVKEQFTKALAQSQNKQGASCETLAGGIADAYPEQLRQRLGKLRVVKVTVNGDNATVTAKLPGAPASSLPLVRDGDGWKIQAPVGTGSTP